MAKKIAAGLTPLQEEFCRQYVIDCKGGAAALRAGYSEKSAHISACNMLKDPKIQDRIAVLKQQHLARLGLTETDVAAMWANIAMFDIRELYHEDGRMKLPHELSATAGQVVNNAKVKQTKVRTYRTGEEGDEVVEVHIDEVVEYKTEDKMSALNSAARYLGMMSDTLEHDLSKSFKELLGSLSPTIGPESAKDVTPGATLLPEANRG